jgi:hypothetical protein
MARRRKRRADRAAPTGAARRIRAQALRDFTRSSGRSGTPARSASSRDLVRATPLVRALQRSISARRRRALLTRVPARDPATFAGVDAATPPSASRCPAVRSDAMSPRRCTRPARRARVGAQTAGQHARPTCDADRVRAHSGRVTRHILDGGRDTIIGSVNADKQALGWARVTDGDPCYFCLTLASRGAVYKTEQTADFQAHDHCGCTAMPLWDGTDWPATREFREIYDAAQRDGVDEGCCSPARTAARAAERRPPLPRRTAVTAATRRHHEPQEGNTHAGGTGSHPFHHARRLSPSSKRRSSSTWPAMQAALRASGVPLNEEDRPTKSARGSRDPSRSRRGRRSRRGDDKDFDPEKAWKLDQNLRGDVDKLKKRARRARDEGQGARGRDEDRRTSSRSARRRPSRRPPRPKREQPGCGSR